MRILPRLRAAVAWPALLGILAIVLLARGTTDRSVASSVHAAESEDGLLAFFSWYKHTEYGPLDLLVLDPDGGAPRVLVEGAVDRSSCGFGLTWSPDGNQIAYVSGNGLWIVNVEGTNNHKVANVCASDIDWSPKGDWLVMYMPGSSRVGLVHPNGKGFRYLDPSNENLSGFDPTFSPDGKTVAMIATGDAEVTGWGVYGFKVADGSLVTRYVDTNLRGQTPGLSAVPSAIDWSPDGETLLVEFWNDGRRPSACSPLGEEWDYPDLNLWTAPARTDSELTRIGSTTAQFNALRERQASWSPSGARIAFTSSHALRCADDGSEVMGPGQGIYSMNVNGSGVKRLFLDPGPVVFGALDLDWQRCGPKTRTCSVPVRKATCRGQVATLVGTPGADTLAGTPQDDIIAGLGGNDTINGGGGNDLICTGAGDDRVNAGDGDDIVHGDAGKDTLRGGAGVDRLNGGAGDDALYGDGDDDQLTGGGGNDVLEGGSGADRLLGVTGNDRLTGGDGDDRLFGGAGADQLDGGAGEDRLVGGGDDDRLRGGGGDDALLGRAGNDDLDGGRGNDQLFAGGGNDVAKGGEGADRVNGEDGDDTVAGGGGTDTVHGNGGSDTLAGDGGSGDVCDGDTGVDVLASGHGCESVVAVP